MVKAPLLQEAFKVGSKGWDWRFRSIQDDWYARLHMGWPLEARRSLFPDWPWLCDESSQHRRALHIPVQILAEKFKMEFLPTISLTKAFLLETILCKFGRICATGNAFVRLNAPFPRSERVGACRAFCAEVAYWWKAAMALKGVLLFVDWFGSNFACKVAYWPHLMIS